MPGNSLFAAPSCCKPLEMETGIHRGIHRRVWGLFLSELFNKGRLCFTQSGEKGVY